MRIIYVKKERITGKRTSIFKRIGTLKTIDIGKRIQKRQRNNYFDLKDKNLSFIILSFIMFRRCSNTSNMAVLMMINEKKKMFMDEETQYWKEAFYIPNDYITNQYYELVKYHAKLPPTQCN
jgi:hypothetical protein